MSGQLSLLDAVQRREKPYKRQRQTARAVYAVRRAADKARAAAGEETREGQVLRVLAWHWNKTQCSPTARELFAWAVYHGEPLDDINSVRPRLTALVESGLIEVAGKRVCAVSGKRVSTWRVREAGSEVGGKGRL